MKLIAPPKHLRLTRHARRTKTCAPLICSAGIFAFSAMLASAANVTWDGGDAVNNAGWANLLNWSTDVAPVDGDVLIFDGSAGLVNTNDFVAGTVFGGINFGASAGAFVLGGNAVSLSGNLVSSSASTETINLDLDLLTTTTARVNGAGTLVLGGVVSSAFGGLTKTGTGTLTLLNAASSYAGTTTVNGGVLSLGAGVPLSASSGLTLGGGEFRIAGSLSMAALAQNSGRDVITLNAPATLTLSNLASRTVGATTLYRGNGLGTAAPGSATNVLFTTAPTLTTGHWGVFAALGTGTLGTTQAAVLRGALADTSASGSGATFATYDTVNGVRGLTSAEQATTYSTAVAGDNVLINLTGATSITGKTTNTLQVNNTSGGALTLTNSGTALWPSNGLLFTGNSAITLTGGTLNFINAAPENNDMIIQSTNTATVTIATTTASSGTTQRSFVLGGTGNFIVTAANVTSSGSGGNYFNGPGTVELRTSNYNASSSGTIVNGGTVRLGTGFGQNTGSTRAISVALGATFDINNYTSISTASGGFDALNNVAGNGGTVTNSGGTMTNLTLSLNNNAGDFAGVVSGNINLILNKQGGTNRRIQKFTNALTYGGSTGVTSSSATEVTSFLTLGAGGNLPSTTAVTLGGVIGSAGLATGNGVLTLGDSNGPVNQTIASLASGGTGTANAVLAGNSTQISTLTVNGSASTTFGGTLGGTFPGDNLELVRAGTGSLTLTGASTYSGGTTISGGTLKVSNTSGSGTGSGPVNLLGGTLAGTGTIAGAVTVAAGAHIAPGASVGTLKVGSLTLALGSVLDWEFNTSPSNDLLNVTNLDGLTLDGGGFNLYNEGLLTPFTTSGVYNLIQFSGTLSGAGTGALSVLNPQPGITYAFGTSGSIVTLTIGTPAPVVSWALTGGGSWSAGTSWSSNPAVPNGSGASATLGGAILAPSTVNLDGSKTVGALTFSNGNAYTIAQGSGGQLMLDNGASAATVTVVAGSHTIDAPVTLVSNTNVAVNAVGETLTISGSVGGGVLTKLGSGTLALTGTNTHAGTVLSGGFTQISSDANLGAAAAPVVVNNGTLQVLAGMTTPRTVQLGAAGSTIQVDSVEVYQLDGSVTESAAGTLNKTGTGTLILNGPASYTGGTSVANGTLQIGTGGATGALGAGPVAITSTLAVNHSGTVTVTGAITGTGSLTMTGGGTLLLSASSSLYTGPVTVTSATLNLGDSNGAGTGTLTLVDSTLSENNVSTTSTNAIVISGASFIDTFGVGNVMTLNGTLSGSGTLTRNGGTNTLALGNSVGNGSFSGTFSNTSGNVSFTHKAAGSAAAVWDFTAGTVTMTSINGTISLGALSGTSPINGTGNAARLSIGNLGLDTTYSGNLTGGANMAVLKTGAGSLTLSGANVIAGQSVSGLAIPTMVSRGTLIAGSSTNGTTSGPFGGSGSSVVLGAAQSSGNSASLFTASLLTGGAYTVANPIIISSGTNTVTPAGYVLTLGGQTDSTSAFSGAITLDNNLTVAQAVTTGGNALLLSGGISGTAAGTGPAGAGTGPENTGTQVVTFAGPGAIKVSGVIANGGGTVGVRVTAGTTTFSTTNAYTGATNVDGGTLVFAASQTLTDLNIADGAIVELVTAAPAALPGIDDGLGEGEPSPAPNIETAAIDVNALVGTDVQAVPEPALAGLLTTGMLVLFGHRRRRSV